MKAIISIILTIMTTPALFAQNFSIGGETGVISSINTDYKVKDLDRRRNTFYAGLNINYKYNRVTLTTGFHYLKQGHRPETCYIFEGGKENALVRKLDYLILPISFNLSFGKSNRIMAVIGTYGGWNINAAQDHPKRIDGCKIRLLRDLSKITQHRVFGGFVGGGFKFYEHDKIKLRSMVKYYQGLSNTKKSLLPNVSPGRDKYSSLLLTFIVDYQL